MNSLSTQTGNQSPVETATAVMPKNSVEDGAGMDPLQLLKRGEHYVVKDIHARGGMGMVLLARDANIRRTVAMKVILPEKQRSGKNMLRFIEEAQVTGQLEHPGIVPIYELGVNTQGQIFYTMKLVKGATLKEVLAGLAKREEEVVRRYPLSQLLTIFQKVCDALAFAHTKGVVHRDLKPDNIMVGEFGETLVLDWGLAKILHAPTAESESGGDFVKSVRTTDSDCNWTMDGTVLGTPAFMAPEQAAGELEKIDARTDIYALGTILYQLLALRPPIEGDSVDEILGKVLRHEIRPMSTDRALPHLPGGRVPDSLAAVAEKAMALRQEDRYLSVPELQREIEAFQNGFATVAEHAGMLRRSGLFLRRHRRVAAAVATVAVVFALWFGGFLVRQQQARQQQYKHLVQAATKHQVRSAWEEAILALTRANQVFDTPASRSALARLLVEGARADLGHRSWSAAAIKLQRALTLIPDLAEAQALMPQALGDGFVSVSARFGGELLEFEYDADLQRVIDPSSGQPKRTRHGPLPVRDLRLAEGYHYFEIWRDGRRQVSLPVRVTRGERQSLALEFESIPEGYEYVHAGEFIMGDDSTEQADGTIGRRSKSVNSFFMKRSPVTESEYMSFWNSPEYERILGAVLKEANLAPSNLVKRAASVRDLTPHMFEEVIHGNKGNIVLIRGLSFYEAQAFARWSGARLPDEAEWEKATRGIDGRLFAAGKPFQTQDVFSISPRVEYVLTPYGCDDLSHACQHWTTSRDTASPNRFIVKGGYSFGSLVEQKPSRRRSLDPMTKYHTVGIALCKDVPPASSKETP